MSSRHIAAVKGRRRVLLRDLIAIDSDRRERRKNAARYHYAVIASVSPRRESPIHVQGIQKIVPIPLALRLGLMSRRLRGDTRSSNGE